MTTKGMETVKAERGKDTAYYIRSLIGLAIMVFFGYLPAPAPITPVGMTVLGQFLGLIFLWTTVDIVWPTFAGIVLFGTVATQVYPNSFALASIYEAGMQSLGNWCIVIVIGLLLICEMLNETGTIRRMALWFLCRPAARKSPWGFSIMFLLAALVVGLFMDVSAAQVFMLALAKEIFSIIGVKVEDKWTKVITIGITFTVVLTFAATPICHTLSILFMSIYSAIAGTPVNWASYMAIALPAMAIIWVIMLGFLRFVVNPDMSKLKNIDFDKIQALHPGPMGKKEKVVITVVALLVISWILPGFLSILAPTMPVTAWFNAITMLTPELVAIVLLAIIRIDGKPILDIANVAGKISWALIFFLAGIMMIASAMGEQTTGITAWVMQVLTPMTQGLSPFAMVAFMAVASVILTNIANNVPVGIVLISVGVPLSLQMGFNPFITAVAISFASNLAYTIPPAFVPVGICYADPFGGGKYTLRWGIVIALVSMIICALVIYPLGILFT